MRILQISSARSLGGGETHVLELAKALSQYGNQVVTAGRRDSAIAPEIHFPFLNSVDVFTAFKLRQLLKSSRFDVVHAHVARDYSIVAAAACGVRNIKVVMTRHLLYPVHSHPLYRRVDGWIAPTSQILRTLEPLHPRLAAVIPNWVDLDKFPYRPKSRVRQQVTLGLLGQISPHKGHDDAVEAMRVLGSSYRLLIGGIGAPEYTEDLKRRSHGLPISFLGFVALPDFFDMVDILLVPSWEEPFGIVLLEAMATGIPLISTAAGGPTDIVRPDRDGVLVPPRNPQALASAVQRVASNAAWRDKMVESARSRIETEFDIRKVVPRIEMFYQKLIGGQ